MVTSRRLRSFVEDLAVKKNIPFQLGVVGGSTDAAAVQLARKGVPILPICIPCRYTHATVEVVSLKDLEATVTLLGQVVENTP
jgi:endoglucanase